MTSRREYSRYPLRWHPKDIILWSIKWYPDGSILHCQSSDTQKTIFFTFNHITTEKAIFFSSLTDSQKTVFFPISEVALRREYFSQSFFRVNQVIPRRLYFSQSNRNFYLDVLKQLRDGIWCNDLKTEVRFLDLAFQQSTNLHGALHNRNLDHAQYSTVC